MSACMYIYLSIHPSMMERNIISNNCYVLFCHAKLQRFCIIPVILNINGSIILFFIT